MEAQTAAPPFNNMTWLVVVGAALINMVNQALFSVFGLIFGNELREMADGQNYGTTTVMAINVMITNITGLFVGPLINIIPTTILTVIGILATGTGMILASFSKTVLHVALTYGIITGLGLGILSSVTFLGINSRFTGARKRTAVGLAMAGTSIGQMLMPLLVGYLLKTFLFRPTLIILGCLSYTGLFGAVLFKIVPEVRSVETKPHSETVLPLNEKSTLSVRKIQSTPNLQDKSQTSLVSEKPFGGSEVLVVDEMNNNLLLTKRSFSLSKLASSQSDDKSVEKMSVSSVELTFPTTRSANKDHRLSYDPALNPFNSRYVLDADENSNLLQKGLDASKPLPEVPEPEGGTFWEKVVRISGIGLLKDIKFVHILFGLALGYTSTVSFSTYFPQFLENEAFLSMTETTISMSILSLADILGRTTISMISAYFNWDSRMTFMISGVGLAIARTILVYLDDAWTIVALSFFIGYLRSGTVINQNLVVSEYVSETNLPSAVGLNMTTKGLVVLVLGQLLGLLSDHIKYKGMIILLNLILLTVIMSWTIELLYHKFFGKPLAITAA